MALHVGLAGGPIAAHHLQALQCNAPSRLGGRELGHRSFSGQHSIRLLGYLLSDIVDQQLGAPQLGREVRDSVPPAEDRPLSAATIGSGVRCRPRVITGVVEGDSDPDTFIPQLVQLHADGRFPYDKFIRTYPFDDINQAVEDAESGAATKAILIVK
jgi:hypothetical protein